MCHIDGEPCRHAVTATSDEQAGLLSSNHASPRWNGASERAEALPIRRPSASRSILITAAGRLNLSLRREAEIPITPAFQFSPQQQHRLQRVFFGFADRGFCDLLFDLTPLDIEGFELAGYGISCHPVRRCQQIDTKA